MRTLSRISLGTSNPTQIRSGIPAQPAIVGAQPVGRVPGEEAGQYHREPVPSGIACGDKGWAWPLWRKVANYGRSSADYPVQTRQRFGSTE